MLCLVLASCGAQDRYPYPDNPLRLNYETDAAGVYSYTERHDNTLVGIGDAGGEAAYDFRLQGVDVTTGQILWRYDESFDLPYLSDWFEVAGPYLYLATETRLEILGDGVLQGTWDYPPGVIGAQFGGRKLALAGETLYLLLETSVTALDVSDPLNPEPLWEREFSTFTFALEPVPGGVAVSVSNFEAISTFGLSAQTGATLWEADTGYRFFGGDYAAPDLLSLNGGVLFAATTDRVQALEPETGETLWASVPLSSDACETSRDIESFVFDAQRLYVAPSSGVCAFALERNSGEVVWRLNASSDPEARQSFGGKPALVGGVLYLQNAYLWSVDAVTGEVLWRSRTPDDIAQGTWLQANENSLYVWEEKLRAYALVDR